MMNVYKLWCGPFREEALTLFSILMHPCSGISHTFTFLLYFSLPSFSKHLDVTVTDIKKKIEKWWNESSVFVQIWVMIVHPVRFSSGCAVCVALLYLLLCSLHSGLCTVCVEVYLTAVTPLVYEDDSWPRFSACIAMETSGHGQHGCRMAGAERDIKRSSSPAPR